MKCRWWSPSLLSPVPAHFWPLRPLLQKPADWKHGPECHARSPGLQNSSDGPQQLRSAQFSLYSYGQIQGTNCHLDQRVTVSLCVAVSMHLIGSVFKRESSIDTALKLGLLLVNGYSTSSSWTFSVLGLCWDTERRYNTILLFPLLCQWEAVTSRFSLLSVLAVWGVCWHYSFPRVVEKAGIVASFLPWSAYPSEADPPELYVQDFLPLCPQFRFWHGWFNAMRWLL